ncbi:UDP-glucose 4-epimerase family protein [Methylobacillus methanolivorans]|uniref:UDP-glucose 4-epimerase family protein n=1 Tax=Methylobacillus methanolivorans TaxID=1848927 RepID=A0ABW8GI42_9PROT
MNKILMTGASGFVGHHLLKTLRSAQSVQVVCAGRRAQISSPTIDYVVDKINNITSWSSAMAGVDVVIHLAARVHVMRDEHPNPIQSFRDTNVDGTLNLARQAAQAGVRRFIFISSIKVNGEQTPAARPFRASDVPNPQDLYGISKYEAEQGLLELAEETGIEVVIIRPPLVYGPGVKGNFASMMKWVQAGWPLPLGAIDNRRSLVSLDNLISLIITCIDHPAAANQVFLASDGEDLSTSDLLRRLADAAGVPSRLIPVPAGVLRTGLSLIGKGAIAQRLLGSLQVDIAKTQQLLGWTPPITADEGLRRCFVTKGLL